MAVTPPPPPRHSTWCVLFICEQILKFKGNVIVIATCKSPVAYFVACYNERSGGRRKPSRALGLRDPRPPIFSWFVSKFFKYTTFNSGLIIYVSLKEKRKQWSEFYSQMNLQFQFCCHSLDDNLVWKPFF